MSWILPNWPAPEHIKALSTNRLGGFSNSPYQGLNLGQHVGDDANIVAKNRDWLVNAAELPCSPIWLNQTHSTHVLEINQSTNNVFDADGTYTSQSDIVCCVMTADCLPVLLTNTDGSQVSAVHAGWRGLVGGILENAVAKMHGEIMAWIGPAIGPEAFEVGDDVRRQFLAVSSDFSEAFVETSTKGKWMANMSLLATKRLNAVGVESVYSSDICTFQDSQRYFSYRRDGVTGRQASVIWIDSKK
ncbi:peptidoglycan editing factor PgeF [Vibrio sp. S4M6]|uniref:peptidoglycan editing factor PgeF n=1 Tax=Vibrio sinus TaxID=2946865 RepID=UPI002029F810|nr:peptidoglycan editing factor PgeF [Vibrio sinus]MCL9781356.1 peptidoglycan editing factor PgeF [Vibrio sinus]